MIFTKLFKFVRARVRTNLPRFFITFSHTVAQRSHGELTCQRPHRFKGALHMGPIYLGGVLLSLASWAANSTDFASEHAEGGHENESKQVIHLTQAQQRLAGIKVTTLIKQFFQSQMYAPGEIKANGYTSYVLSPRVDSLVVKRHATLGQHITKGAPLVTLFSADVATGQTQYRLAKAQWNRLKKMKAGTVSEKEALIAQVEYEVAYSQLAAFGLTNTDIEQSIDLSPQSLGEYTLYAQTSGAILSDDFAQGQRVDSGTELMLIADETNLWVDAQLSANQTLNIAMDTPVKIKVNNRYYSAKVSQEAHTINQITRTRVVRLTVENTDHTLHPGMFTDVYFSFQADRKVLAVPESALMRTADGDWSVFVAGEANEFTATDVELGKKFVGMQQIIGLKEGVRVVTHGAFFVMSEQAKTGFDPHNH
jgi:RND family efflux transporter MFP subunit